MRAHTHTALGIGQSWPERTGRSPGRCCQAVAYSFFPLLFVQAAFFSHGSVRVRGRRLLEPP